MLKFNVFSSLTLSMQKLSAWFLEVKAFLSKTLMFRALVFDFKETLILSTFSPNPPHEAYKSKSA